MTTSATQPRELIPGYLATERLGAGGYGEVWKVDAPGGLTKAVKLVYGFIGDERAERELKSLHRIKEVRHPFVLSLERIEVIDGRLLIVTELAEMSLMDRFQQCQTNDSDGIPRGELLTYLSDAADALDYMRQSHSLQHLDIKPENLLLIGGRAKVADFGLVKELADHTRSMVGAMTPTYAAPELFDGEASEHCDQYSLAILYQEMRTGVLPFPGRTVAQLAAQHTQSQPQLTPLPPAERPIVQRALAKRAEDRYATCQEFVRALLAVEESLAPARSAPQTDTDKYGGRDTGSLSMDDTHPADAPQATQVMNARLSSRSIDVKPKPTIERPCIKARSEIVDVPPPDETEPVTVSAKTLVIGVGGTGMAVLGNLNRLLHSSDDNVRAAMQLLAFDTDPTTTRQASALGMNSDDVVLLRLRQAHEYRSDAEALLKWIGRRWLYNIPRSAQTDGLRPLGRLALVDHAGVVVRKIRRRLSGLLKGDEHDGQPAGDDNVPLRVILIGACSGGTGGGMLLELACAAKNIASQVGRDDVEITTVVAHATNRTKTTKQLAQANAYSFLSEAQHYIRYGSRSPDTTAPQAAIYESDVWPVRDLYFCHLGDDLDSQQFADGTRQIANYLFADVATPMGASLRACRRQPIAEQAPDNDIHVRSLHAHRFEGPSAKVRAAVEQLLLADVKNVWFRSASASFEAPEEYAENDAATHPANTRNTCPEYVDRLGTTYIGQQIRHWISSLPPQTNAGDVALPDSNVGVFATEELQAFCEQLIALKSNQGTDLPRTSQLAEAMSLTEGDLLRRLKSAGDSIAEDVLRRCLTSMNSPRNGHPSSETIKLQSMLSQEIRQASISLLSDSFPSAKLNADGQWQLNAQALVESLAVPQAHPCGGTRRTLVLRPSESEMEQEIDKALGRTCGFRDGCPSAVIVCEELEDISLAQLAHTIASQESETRSVAARIHTRADIKWTEPARVSS